MRYFMLYHGILGHSSFILQLFIEDILMEAFLQFPRTEIRDSLNEVHRAPEKQDR